RSKAGSKRKWKFLGERLPERIHNIHPSFDIKFFPKPPIPMISSYSFLFSNPTQHNTSRVW
ncbi:unnamed protein product, partial [Prunus brigantina]